MIDLKHIVTRDWLPPEISERYLDNYPVDYIKEYCSNPDVAEHLCSLDGNFSAPAEEFDPELKNYVQSKLNEIMIEGLGAIKEYDHFYINYHYDTQGAWIEPHNDLKDFRWRITNQIYMNHNQGARLLDRKLNILDEFPCEPNVFYNIVAGPWSWHDVPHLTSVKKSILFRIGKRRHRTVAHYDENSDDAYLIFNHYHADSHYAKLGFRMGNLTEAWLHKLGAKNIYHSGWRSEETLIANIGKALSRHKKVHVLCSGFMPASLEEIKNNNVVQTLTRDNDTVDTDGFMLKKHTLGYYRLTDDNIDEYAKIVFETYDVSDHHLAVAERLMSDYYKNNLHLNYKSI